MQSCVLVRNVHCTHTCTQHTTTHRVKFMQSLAGWLLPGISITASFHPQWSDASSASLLYRSLSFSIFLGFVSPPSNVFLYTSLLLEFYFLLPKTYVLYNFSHTLFFFSTLSCFHTVTLCHVGGCEVVTICLSCSHTISSPFPRELFFPKYHCSCGHDMELVFHWNAE